MKPMQCFGRRYDSTSLQSWCKTCCQESSRRWAKEHPDATRPYSESYSLRHAGRRRQQWRSYWARNPERAMAIKKEQLANGTAQKYRRSYIARNAQKVLAAYQSKSRRRRAGVQIDIDESVVFQRDAWICRICMEPITESRGKRGPSIDHIVPLSRGGAHTMENVQASHLICNMRKSDKVV